MIGQLVWEKTDLIRGLKHLVAKPVLTHYGKLMAINIVGIRTKTRAYRAVCNLTLPATLKSGLHIMLCDGDTS